MALIVKVASCELVPSKVTLAASLNNRVLNASAPTVRDTERLLPKVPKAIVPLLARVPAANETVFPPNANVEPVPLVTDAPSLTVTVVESTFKPLPSATDNLAPELRFRDVPTIFDAVKPEAPASPLISPAFTVIALVAVPNAPLLPRVITGP